MTHIRNNIQYKIYFGNTLPTVEWCNVYLEVQREEMMSSSMLNGKHLSRLVTGI